MPLWVVQRVKTATMVQRASSCVSVSMPRDRATRSLACAAATLDTGGRDVTAVSRSLGHWVTGSLLYLAKWLCSVWLVLFILTYISLIIDMVWHGHG